MPVGIHVALQRIVVDGLVGLIRDHFLLFRARLRQESFPAQRGGIFIANAAQQVAALFVHFVF